MQAARQEHRVALDPFHAAENGPDGDPHAKRQKFHAPPPVHIGFSSGSDVVIGRMSEPQNLSRAAAFLSEGLIFLSWISDQNAQHKGLRRLARMKRTEKCTQSVLHMSFSVQGRMP